MKNKLIGVFLVIALIIFNCEAKRGGFGGFSRGGGSKSGGGWSSRPSPSRPSPSYSAPSYKPAPSPSYGWSPSISSPSRPSPSYSAPSYKPAPSPSYGWSPSVSSPSRPAPAAPSPSYGWSPSVSSGSSFNQPKPAAPAPSYGWAPGINTGSKPVGPPPSYPGLNNQAVPSHNKPPAYSPSYNNPPSYSHPSSYSPSNSYRPANSPSNSYVPANSPNYARPSYSTGSGYYGNNNYGNSYNPNQGYGSTFGSGGLGSNTYISNNYYGNSRSSGFGGSGGSGFLSNALFFGAGMSSGYMWGNRNSYRDRDSYNNRRWDEDDDRRWRATTKAPYFENKVPGSEVVLPAAAVVGAATAFGLASLLPLNVPSNKPLMYCDKNSSDIAQTQILLNEKVYQCINETISVSNFNCFKLVASNTTENLQNNTEASLSNSTETTISSCDTESKIMQCDGGDNIYCTNGTLLSRIEIFCNSTTLMNGTTNLNDSTMALTCFEGRLADKQTAFIPTTTTTEAPITTTEKPLSWTTRMHLFFVRMIGKGDSVQKLEPTTTAVPEEIPQQSVDETLPVWVPEALTIPPEPTTTTEAPTTTPKMIWMMRQRTFTTLENGTKVYDYEPTFDLMQTNLDQVHQLDPNNELFTTKFYVRMVSSTEAPNNSTTTENIESSTQSSTESTTQSLSESSSVDSI